MNVIQFTTDFFDSNNYLFEKNGVKFMVDCGGTTQYTANVLKQYNFIPDIVLLTHGHIDHILALSALKELGAKVFIHSNDACYLTDSSYNLSSYLIGQNFVCDCNTIDEQVLKEYGIDVLHTPGHSPGSVCYLIDDILFSGDTLFCGGIGNTSFPGGDHKTEITSVKRLLLLDKAITVYPGHGPKTTIAAEQNIL